jgi:uncharacterized protein YbjT (DUF2867 family)
MIFKDAISKLGERFAVHHFDPRAGPILVTEGQGVVAYRVSTRLLASGFPNLRVGAREPQDMAHMEQAGAKVVKFNWEEEDTYKSALEGVKTVFCVIPHNENWETQFKTFLAVAKAAGVKNIVKLSFYHALSSEADTMMNFANTQSTADPFHKIPLVLMHRTCDSMLMKSAASLNYTILFASHFASNVVVYQADSLRQDGVFYGASANKKVNYVSPNDIADVAVRALLAPQDHYRVGYTLTGPESVKDAEVAELLSKRLAKPVNYVNQSLGDFAGVTKDTDWGPSTDVAYLEMAKASGTEEQTGFVSHDVQKICGHPAESFGEYLLAQDMMAPQELDFLKP